MTARTVVKVGRIVAVPAMLLVLALYVAIHSPMLSILGGLLGRDIPISTVERVGIIDAGGLNAAAVVGALVASLAAAVAVTRHSPFNPHERTLVRGVLAFAFVVVPAAWIGGLAALTSTPLLRPPLGLLLVGIPAGAVASLAILRGRRLVTVPPDYAWPGGLVLTLAAAALVLLGTSVGISSGRPPTGFDALSYHAPMAVYFWRDGNIVDLLARAPWGFALAQPGAAELWFGLLLNGFGERAANIGQVPFALLGAAAVRTFSRRLGFPRRPAAVAALAFLIAPIVAIQAGIQVTDLAAAALIMSAVALASAPAATASPFRSALVGLALGLAVTVKVAVLPAAAATILVASIVVGRTARVSRTGILRLGLACSIAFAVAAAPWWVRNAIHFGNPVYPAALPILGRGVIVGEFERKDTRFVPHAAVWPLYPLLEKHNEQSGLGPLFLVGALPGVLVAFCRAGRRRVVPLTLYAGVGVTSLVAWWTLTQHEPRHLLAPLGLTFAFLPGLLWFLPRARRCAGAVVLGIAAVCSVLITLDQGLAPRAREPLDRARFYDEVWNVDPIVAESDMGGLLLYNTGYASLSYAGDYALLGPALDRVLLTVDTGASTRDIVALMERFGAKFAYVPASPRYQTIVKEKYSGEVFELAHVSSVTAGKRTGTKRYLFRLRQDAGLTTDAASREGSVK